MYFFKQLVIFGKTNQEMVTFMNDSTDVFHAVLLNESMELYKRTDLYAQLNNIRKQVLKVLHLISFLLYVKFGCILYLYLNTFSC